MERQIWKKIVMVLDLTNKPRESVRYRFKSVDIVRVILWAVLHDRPISWATRPENWPLHERRRPLPSNTTISRRYRCKNVQLLLKQVEQLTLLPKDRPSLVSAIDAKPLPIGGCSKDRQAGYGRAAASKAKGYKLHTIISLDGSVLEWRVAPMNKDERVMARRMVKKANPQGYLLGDGNFDSNPLHAVCSKLGGVQLVAPRRRGGGLGHHRHDPGRLRSVEILENPFPIFGQKLLKLRDGIERFFANLTNWGGSLTTLPPWARTHKRVHRWVQGKLIINALKRQTYDC